MKWFRHYSDARDDPALSALMDEFGAEGYGVYWLIVESIAKQIHDCPRDSVEYSERKWCSILNVYKMKFNLILISMEFHSKFSVLKSKRNGICYVKIGIPKLLEIADEYTKKRVMRKGKEEQSVRTKSAKYPEKIRVDKIRLDKIRVYKKDINHVFDYWKSTLNHLKSKSTRDREAKIKARLVEGYSVADLKKAIDGCKASIYHMGANDQGKVYDSIELLFRNGGKVESFWQYVRESKGVEWLKKKKEEEKE